MCWCQNIEKCLITKPPCSNSKNQTLMPLLTVHVYASHYLFLFGKGMYVDDTLTALPKDKVQHFHEHLNSIESTIQFTVEMEPEGTLPFLDTRIMHQSDGFLSTMVFRKSTHTDKYLDFQFHHRLAHKVAVAHTLFDCAENICTDFPGSEKRRKMLRRHSRTTVTPKSQWWRTGVHNHAHNCPSRTHPQPLSPYRTSVTYLRPSKGYWPHSGFAHPSGLIAHFDRCWRGWRTTHPYSNELVWFIKSHAVRVPECTLAKQAGL